MGRMQLLAKCIDSTICNLYMFGTLHGFELANVQSRQEHRYLNLLQHCAVTKGTPHARDAVLGQAGTRVLQKRCPLHPILTYPSHERTFAVCVFDGAKTSKHESASGRISAFKPHSRIHCAI